MKFVQQQRQAILNYQGGARHEISEKLNKQDRYFTRPPSRKFVRTEDGWSRIAPPPPRPMKRMTKRHVDLPTELRRAFVDPIAGPIKRFMGER